LHDISLLDARQATRELGALAQVLVDCVEGGARVNFVMPFGTVEAEAFWKRTIQKIEAGTAVLLAAHRDGSLVGTAMLDLDTPPNQRHRADVKKVLVHRRARRCGLARALMARIEDEARARGRTLLTLDTERGSVAEQMYKRLGYCRFGIVPRYAVAPDGRGMDDCSFFYKELAPAV
jgi:GNAT superfamily N-acetyltransferase